MKQCYTCNNGTPDWTASTDHNPFKKTFSRMIVTYDIVKTEKGYRILKDRVFFLDGMQLRFLYDLKQNQVPDLDMVLSYFESLDQFEELVMLELVTIHPQRIPALSEKKLIQSKGCLYYGMRASIFEAKLTDEGKRLLAEVMDTDIFSECMTSMDEKMAETFLKRREYA